MDSIFRSTPAAYEMSQPSPGQTTPTTTFSGGVGVDGPKLIITQGGGKRRRRHTKRRHTKRSKKYNKSRKARR
jgi:hypothetical protein